MYFAPTKLRESQFSDLDRTKWKCKTHVNNNSVNIMYDSFDNCYWKEQQSSPQRDISLQNMADTSS